MDTINITANGQSISFSTKSLTINGKEFLYTGISAIKHSSAKHLYLFKYEGDWHSLYYEDGDQKKIAAIFKRIAEMNARRTRQQKPAEEAAKAEEATPATAGEADQEEKKDENAEKPAEGETTGEQADSESVKDSDDEKTSAEDKPAEGGEASEESDKKAEKKKKLRKSIIVFIIIIALFAAAGVAYFFILGPANDASHNNTNSTHQYDDIEELIDEMQE